ncbi:MAG: serine hydrolase domain-containing protein, partial [Candidatus Kariarchaeaceae archaeon]
PDKFGFNSEEVYSLAEDLPYLRSILVVCSGKLITERYFNDGDIASAFHIHSATKSFMSTLRGIAYNQNILTDLDQKMMDFFPDYEYLDLDPRKYNITIRHLLSMKAGFNFNDTGDDWIRYSSSSDWVKYALELPLLHDPGKDWHYGTPQSNLLSAILTRVSGMSTYAYAKQYLFTPLEISPAYWFQDPQGIYTGGHELYFSPRDLARFGFLYLNNGTVDNLQIIPHQWIIDSWTDYADRRVDEGMGSSFYRTTGYGYQWWLVQLEGHKTYSARGHGGQFIFVVPKLDLVIVTTAKSSVFESYPFQFETMFSIISVILDGMKGDNSDQKKAVVFTKAGFVILYSIIGIMIRLISLRHRNKFH